MVKRPIPAPLEPREFRSPEEIESAITKLRRRIDELGTIDLVAAAQNSTGAVQAAESNLRDTILTVFGANSPEFREHAHIRNWAGALFMGMSDGEFLEGYRRGQTHAIGILNGLIRRLEEKRTDLGAGAPTAPSTYFDRLNLHPRILDVSRDLFIDGHPWDAVFAAAKALINYVKERSGRHDLDGTSLVRTVFSPKAPILAFNELADLTDHDEQEGMMHLFEGAVLAIRNPGGHSFPE